MGWRTAIKSQNVRAIVSYEPGSGFVFPADEVPPPIPSSGGTLAAVGIPSASSCSSRRFRSSSTTGISSRTRPSRMAARTDGAHGCRWRGCGVTPSTRGAATSRWSTSRGRPSRQHALSLFGSEQRASRGPDVRVVAKEGAGQIAISSSPALCQAAVSIEPDG